MGRLSLRARILGAFLLSFLSFCGVLGFGLLQLDSIGGGLDVIDRGYLPLAKIVGQMEGQQSRLDLQRLQETIPKPDSTSPKQKAPPPSIDGSQKTVPGLEAANAEERKQLFFIRLKDVKRSAAQLSALTQLAIRIIDDIVPDLKSADERKQLLFIRGYFSRIASAHAQQQEVVQTYLLYVESGKDSDAQAVKPQLQDAQSDLRTEIEQVSKQIQKATKDVSKTTSDIQNRAVVLAAVLTLVALIFGGLMLILAVFALRPIGKLTGEVQRIAAGDYAARAQVRSRDEVGILAEEINAMAASIEGRDEALRARAEELEGARMELRAVLDAINIGLVVVSDDEVRLANPAAVQLWNLQIGTALPTHLQISGERDDGLTIEDKVYAMRKVPFQDGFILAGEDITQALHDRERLVHTERLALVGQMLAQITHEVRNPLNALSLNAELLADEVTSLPETRKDEGLDILRTMTSEIQRLEEVTEHYLSLVRRPAPLPGQHVPNEVVEGVVKLLDEELKRSGVDLSVSGPQLEAIEMDDGQLRRALMNVVRNAVEAGATKVEVGLRFNQKRLFIDVSDNGEGMSVEQIARASEPFFSTKAAGTGLGLAITRQILEDHGGGLEIQSQNEGTLVSLILPG